MRPLNRPMFKSGGPIKEGIMSGMQDRPGYSVGRIVTGALSQIPKFFKSQPSVIGSGKGIPGKYTPAPLTTVEKIKQFFQTAPAGKFAAGTTEGKLIGNLISGSGVVPRVIKGTAKTAAKSPLATGTIVYYGGGALLPDGKPDPNDPKNIKPAGERGKSGAPGGGDPNMFLTPKEKKLSDAQKDKITKDRIEANRERYYKLMGIDKMQKGAAYDSLIDASKIIQQEGGDLKGAIKSGSLQSQIIDAISKNLDKSTDLKRQIDAAILKGEIEKDIKASDPQAQKRAEYIDKQIQLADKTLAGGSLIENIQAGAKAAGNVNSTTNVYNSVIRSLDIEPEVLKDTAETIKLRKTDDYTTDEALVKKIVEAENKGPGVYIIDKSVILVDAQGNTRTLALG